MKNTFEKYKTILKYINNVAIKKKKKTNVFRQMANGVDEKLGMKDNNNRVIEYFITVCSHCARKPMLNKVRLNMFGTIEIVIICNYKINYNYLFYFVSNC